ncbi:MAG: TonB family protein [Verrucomicrobiae bacterium]|jgi:protein TonB|nr:TonB family protein [Verrucomicrobiae bacterium]
MRPATPSIAASPVYHAPPQRGLPWLSALLSAAFTAGIFVAFAVFQVQPVEPALGEQPHALATVEKPPPPVRQTPPKEQREPVEAEPVAQVTPELASPAPPLQLNQLNVRLVPDFETRLSGEFDLDFQTFDTASMDFKVFDLSEVEGQPSALFVPRPTYPASLRKSGISGRVVVECVIDSEGAASRMRVHDSTHRAFNVAAMEAVSRARFQPATKGGRAVAARALIPFRFEAPGK